MAQSLIQQTRFVIILALIALLGVFAFQNVAAVDLKFLFWTFEARRIFVIAFSLVIGLVIGWLLGRFRHRR